MIDKIDEVIEQIDSFIKDTFKARDEMGEIVPIENVIDQNLYKSLNDLNEQLTDYIIYQRKQAEKNK